MCLLGQVVRVLRHILQHAHVFRVALVEINEILILKTWGPFVLHILGGGRLRLDIRDITSKAHCDILAIVICPIVGLPLVLQGDIGDSVGANSSHSEFFYRLTFVFLFLDRLQ